MVRLVGSDRDLLRRQHLTMRALELWRSGTMCTFSIAQELSTDEREVCHIIDDAEGRAAKFEEERA